MSRQRPLEIVLNGQLEAFRIDVAFTAPSSGVTGLFGPSGCGKTTVLRCIAGLTKLPGRIEVAGEVWQDSAAGVFRPAHERHVGYVFQEASLFPHLTVRQNLLFGAARVGHQQRQSSLDDIVSLLGIGQLLARFPDGLSGGERQRVAIGRALLSEPRILLMDEPLSALDRMTKEDILPYLERLHEQLALPILYVSHDIAELERLADTLVLMQAGRVVASGALRSLQTDPALPLLAMPEATVALNATIKSVDEDFALTELALEGGSLLVPGRHGSPGERRRIRIAASDVSLAWTAPKDSTILNCLPCRIMAIDKASSDAQLNVILALGTDGSRDRIVARITKRSMSLLNMKVGSNVFAQIKSVALIASRTRITS